MYTAFPATYTCVQLSQVSGHRGYIHNTVGQLAQHRQASCQSNAITGDEWHAVAGMMTDKYSAECEYDCTAIHNLVTFYNRRRTVDDGTRR